VTKAVAKASLYGVLELLRVAVNAVPTGAADVVLCC